MGLGQGLVRPLESLSRKKGLPQGLLLRVPEEGPTSRGVWVVPGSPGSPPLSCYSLLQVPAPLKTQFPLLYNGEGVDIQRRLMIGAWTPQTDTLGSRQFPLPSTQPRPFLPHSLPRGTHLLLGKLIHYSLKAPFLAGSKLPALHFAATT